MARNRQVQRNQLQMWLGFTAFFALMAVLSVVVTLCLGIPLDPVGVVVAVVLLVALVGLFIVYRRSK